ncbi:MAG: hypothetical protein R3B72_07440 [Polyangiaceae bacterium]
METDDLHLDLVWGPVVRSGSPPREARRLLRPARVDPSLVEPPDPPLPSFEAPRHPPPVFVDGDGQPEQHLDEKEAPAVVPSEKGGHCGATIANPSRQRSLSPPERRPDAGDGLGRLLDDELLGKPENLEAVSDQLAIAPRIGPRLLDVIPAIDLDDEPARLA